MSKNKNTQKWNVVTHVYNMILQLVSCVVMCGYICDSRCLHLLSFGHILVMIGCTCVSICAYMCLHVSEFSNKHI